MKIYNNIILIKKDQIEKLKSILKINKINKKEINNNALKRKIKSIYLSSKVKGKYTLRTLKRIYFNKDFNEDPEITILKENNITLFLNLKKVYYDLSYCTERQILFLFFKETFKEQIEAIDVLYGGIGILGFYLAKLKNILKINIVDFNVFCQFCFLKSLDYQSKDAKKKLIFIKGTVNQYIKETTAKIAICIAPLSKISLKKLSSKYFHLFFYLLLKNNLLNAYEQQLKKYYTKIHVRKVKEYSIDSAIYLFYLSN